MALALSQGKKVKSKENIIKSALLLPSAHFSLCSLVVLICHCSVRLIVALSFFITEHVYTYISRHMFLISHSHAQCLRYSLSSGCWLKKDPLNLGGVFRTPPISRDQQALLQTPQDVVPRAGNGKAPLDYGIKGITWSISGKKQILTLTAQFPFKDSHMLCHCVT